MTKTSIEKIFQMKNKECFGFSGYNPLIHYFDAIKQIDSRTPIVKAGKPRVKPTKKGSYLDFFTKQNFKLLPKAKFYNVINELPDPKPKEKKIKIKPTRRDTFIDVIFNQKKDLRVIFKINFKIFI